MRENIYIYKRVCTSQLRVVNSELGDMTLQFRIIVRIVGNKQAILTFLWQLQVYISQFRLSPIQIFFLTIGILTFFFAILASFLRAVRNKLTIVSYKLIKVLIFVYNCNEFILKHHGFKINLGVSQIGVTGMKKLTKEQIFIFGQRIFFRLKNLLQLIL